MDPANLALIPPAVSAAVFGVMGYRETNKNIRKYEAEQKAAQPGMAGVPVAISHQGKQWVTSVPEAHNWLTENGFRYHGDVMAADPGRAPRTFHRDVNGTRESAVISVAPEGANPNLSPTQFGGKRGKTS